MLWHVKLQCLFCTALPNPRAKLPSKQRMWHQKLYGKSVDVVITLQWLRVWIYHDADTAPRCLLFKYNCNLPRVRLITGDSCIVKNSQTARSYGDAPEIYQELKSSLNVCLFCSTWLSNKVYAVVLLYFICFMCSEKLLCSLAGKQQILLYHLSDGSRVNRLWLGWLLSFSVLWALCWHLHSLILTTHCSPPVLGHVHPMPVSQSGRFLLHKTWEFLS